MELKQLKTKMEYRNTTKYSSYKRYCKTLELKNDPGLIEEYKRIHSGTNIWPEVTDGMRDVGIVDMEIYLVETRLFMIMDTLPDFNHQTAMTELMKKSRQSEWEKFVSRFQITTEDEVSTDKWELVERIFKMND